MAYDPTKPYKHQILELIQSTWTTPWLTVRPGMYPIFERTFQGLEVDHTDGIGTKGELHWRHRTFPAAVQDALAMNLNDLVMARAQAYKLQNHLVLPSDDHRAILEIIQALVVECRKRQIVITGGETSIHRDGTLDVSLTVAGRVLNTEPNQIQPGDVVLGLPSSGIHANGLTKFREIVKDEVVELTTPTPIYADVLLPFMQSFPIHGMMHITGGAMTKLKDIAQGVDVVIERNHGLRPQKIFQRAYEHGVSDEELYRTWNCGIGFIVTIEPGLAEKVEQRISATRIGRAQKGPGIITVQSQFSSAVVSY